MILTGMGGIIIIEIYTAVMQREFQYNNNRVGKGFAILGIFLFDVCYCKYTTQEFHPLHSYPKRTDLKTSQTAC
jgi:hypothetical protein